MADDEATSSGGGCSGCAALLVLILLVLGAITGVAHLLGWDKEEAPVAQVMPALEGKSLGQASDELTKLGFDDINPKDVVEDRTPVDYDNWVVLEQVPAAGSRVMPDVRVELKVAKYSDPGYGGLKGGGSGEAFVPNVTGMSLNQAFDALKAAGFGNVTTLDFTGRGRLQVVQSNWVVAGQDPDDRSSPIKQWSKITLYVVKYDD